ncbi:MAG TPA: sialidase family protein [Thermoanaerobaculia bacterium]
MRRFLMMGLMVTLAASVASAAPNRPNPAWPSVDQQLAKDKVEPGSPLEKLIRANQDFQMLRPEEANDKIPVPGWLRVAWRKEHPEGNYTADDPTGGYPHALKEIHEWMVKHQDLVPNQADVWKAAEDDEDMVLGEKAVGSDRRISGAQTVPRSESDIRIDYWNPNRIIAGSNNIGGSGQQAMYWSADGGTSWGQTFLPFTGTDSFHSDPTVDWQSTGTAWSSTLGIRGFNLVLRVYNSTNGGQTWSYSANPSGRQKAVDKQMKWVDHSATSPFKDYMYICWHNNNPQFVARRTAAGVWSAAAQISGTESTGTAIGCDVRTNAAGDAFVFWPTTGNRRIIVSKSTNGGGSWGTPKVIATTFDGYDIGIPSFNSRRALIYVSGGAYGSNVYATWTDLTGVAGCNTASNEPGSNVASTCKSRIWFARSTDGGNTWGAPVMINNQPTLNDQFNQWLGVDETNGRLAVIYYDTVADPGRKKTNIFYQTSTDNGATWSVATPITTLQTDETIAGADSGNQYGDYNSLSIYAGKIFPSWTDRRNNGKEEIWTAPITEP